MLLFLSCSSPMFLSCFFPCPDKGFFILLFFGISASVLEYYVNMKLFVRSFQIQQMFESIHQPELIIPVFWFAIVLKNFCHYLEHQIIAENLLQCFFFSNHYISLSKDSFHCLPVFTGHRINRFLEI